MGDQVEPQVVQRTQEMLRPYFQKPPLTDKLLKKPPFRFLHDIVRAVIAETGFLGGLYSPQELDSDNFKDKQAKIKFLTKLIKVVELVHGSKLAAKPTKIVAGLEPKSTNELLQAIASALQDNKSSDDAVKRYRAAASKPLQQQQQPQGTTATTKKGPSPAQASNEREARRVGKSKPAGAENRERSVHAGRPAATGTGPSAKKDVVKRTKGSSAPKPSDGPLKALAPNKPDAQPPAQGPPDRVEETAKEQPEPLQGNAHSAANGVPVSPDKPPAAPPSAAEQPARRPASSVRRPASASRPASARPAAPRIRPAVQQQDSVEASHQPQQPEDTVATVFQEDDPRAADDTEDMVVIRSQIDYQNPGQPLANIDQQQHGHLVAQILETQKELTNTAEVSVMPQEIDTSHERIMLSAESTAKEMETLRKSIQDLTRNTNPLGRLLDYFQENIQVMRKEMLEWRVHSENYQKELEQKQKMAQKYIEPLRQSLQTVDSELKLEIDRIQQCKQGIRRNDEKINKSISGMG